MNVPHLLDFLEASLSGKALDKARRNQGRTDWTGVQTQYSEKWSLFWSVAALKTVVYPFHFISFLTHQYRYSLRVAGVLEEGESGRNALGVEDPMSMKAN